MSVTIKWQNNEWKPSVRYNHDNYKHDNHDNHDTAFCKYLNTKVSTINTSEVIVREEKIAI